VRQNPLYRSFSLVLPRCIGRATAAAPDGWKLEIEQCRQAGTDMNCNMLEVSGAGRIAMLLFTVVPGVSYAKYRWGKVAGPNI